MAESYEENYWRIGSLAELPEGLPKLFRAAGSSIVIVRVGERIEAIDTASGAPLDAQTRGVMDRIIAGKNVTRVEWNALVAVNGLPARVEDGSVWVCIDACGR